MKDIFKVFNKLSSQEIIDLFEAKITDNEIWKGRFLALLIPISEVIFHYNTQKILFSQSFDEFLEFDNIVKIYNSNTIPEKTKIKLGSYLRSLPAYNINMIKQSQTTEEMHGYISMGLSRIFKDTNR